jgi:hypothetical protein
MARELQKTLDRYWRWMHQQLHPMQPLTIISTLTPGPYPAQTQQASYVAADRPALTCQS